MEPSSDTRVQLCGRLAVVLGGERVEDRLPGPQGRLLFAYLVLNRQRHVGRDQLIAAIWPGDTPPSADQGLRSLLSKLRRALGPDLVAGRDDTRVTLPAHAFVDLEFAHQKIHEAESAVRLGEWGRAWAPARAALHTADRGFFADADAPWIASVRHDLEDLRVRALESVAAVGLALGGPELAATERAGRALIAAAPFRESGYGFLIRALVAQQNVGEAILVHDQLRRSLRELGIGPSGEMQELHRALLETR